MLRPLTLTAAEFEGLSLGHGSPSALAVLLDGQLAKRQMLVFDLVRQARAAGGEFRDTADSVSELMLAAEEKAPEAVRAVVAHPQVDLWAMRCRQLFERGDRAGLADHFGYLSALGAAAAVRAGISFTIRVPVVSGSVALPTLGVMHGLDSDAVTVRGDETGVTFDGHSQNWRPVRSVDLRSSGGPLLAIEDGDRYRGSYPWPATPPLSPAAFDRLSAACEQAWRIIVGNHPGYTAGAAAMLRALVPLTAPREGEDFSASNRRTCGAVGIVPPADPAALALLMLHECQHMKLGALLDLVDLCEPTAHPDRYRVGWRPDPRPVEAVLQGAYAHVSVTEVWRARRHTRADPSRAEFEYAYWRAQTTAAVDALLSSDELTDHGVSFVRGLARTLAGWADEPVSREAGLAAQVATAATATVWRLRNHRLYPDDLDLMRAAWHAGLTCPQPPAPALANPAEPAMPADPARLLTTIRRGWRAEPAGTGPASDLALLSGEPSTAAALYGASIQKAECVDEWAGLHAALAETDGSGVAERPERARALYLALVAERQPADGQRPVDPVAVARWCAVTAGKAPAGRAAHS